SGGGWLDADGDGLLDLYLVQSGPVPGAEEDPVQAGSSNRLFRNLGDDTFEDVTAASGAGDAGYGMGACFGDVDNDGHVDIYVTNYGPDALLRNRGDGSFESTSETFFAVGGWSTSCAFADFDRDGWLDLYVVRYVDFRLENHRPCGPPGQPQYCHPDVYEGVSDILLRNLGTGETPEGVRFEDVTQTAGVGVDDPAEAKGLGVVWTDYDDDGWIDLYVSNDSTRNFLFRNLGDGTFQEIGALVGAAYNELGVTEAGMGVDAGDLDGDGRLDLVVTNLDFETNTFYRNLEAGFFEDGTTRSGLGPASLERVGFGTVLLDVDLDGDLDLFIANGHILDNVAERNPTLSYAQPDQLFLNDGKARFDDASDRLGAAFTVRRVGRGAATADFDDDGDLDLLVTHSEDEAVLLRNELQSHHHWLGLRLRSRHGGRDALGARAWLAAGGRTWVDEVHSGSSYLSQSDPRLVFGLGEVDSIEQLEIRWGDGERETIPGHTLSINAYNEIQQAP
ncbi:MAG: CRTAC1 family protein, partial [Acidobacteriota bacterium]